MERWRSCLLALCLPLLHALSADTVDIELQWKYRTSGKLVSEPVVFDNSIYVTSFDGYLTALTMNGDLKWKFQAPDLVRAAPTLFDGQAFVASYSHYLHVIDLETGTQNWSFKAEDDIASKPVIVDRVVYFGCYDTYVYAVDIDSQQLRWKYQVGKAITSSGTAHNGRFYIGSNDNYLYALSLTEGTQLWRFRTGASIFTTPAVDSESGNIVFGSDDHKVYCVSPQGNQIWSYLTSNRVKSSPVIHGNIVYVGGFGSVVYAIDHTTGELVWTKSTLGRILSTPVVFDEKLWVGSTSGHEYILNLETGVEEGSFYQSSDSVSTVATSGNVVLIPSGDSYLYAVSLATPAVCAADGVWPETSPGDEAESACQTGYSGTQTRGCVEGGVWEDADTSLCLPIYCSATGVWPMTRAGDSVSITCGEGETGMKVRACYLDGTFGPTDASACSMVTCEHSSDGWVQTAYGHNATRSCPNGFEGEMTRVCQADGTFSDVDDSSCVQLFCESKEGWSKTAAGATATADCPGGFEGSQFRVCGWDGSWGAVDVSHCDQLMCPSDGEWLATVAGSSAAIPCPDGTSGTQLRQCSDSGTWGDVSLAMCTDILCVDPSGLYNVTRAGSTALRPCELGFTGFRTRQCSLDGEFGPEDSSMCEQVYCEGSGGWERTRAGMNATEPCPAGEEGVLLRPCSWDGAFGKVDDSQCAYLHCSTDQMWPDTLAGKSVVVECNRGYEGQRRRDCSLTGEWDDEVSNCSRIVCQGVDPFPAVHAGESVSAACAPGFTGERTLTCDLDGVLSDPNTSNCIEIYCDPEDGWPQIQAGYESKLPCSQNYTGRITRRCDLEGNLEEPNMEACIEASFISTLIPSAGRLNFDPEKKEYSMLVPDLVSSISFEIVPGFPDLEVAVNGGNTSSVVPVGYGNNEIIVAVTGPSGEEDYIINLTRLQPCLADGVWPRTRTGETADAPCDPGYSGSLFRHCFADDIGNGIWQNITEVESHCSKIPEKEPALSLAKLVPSEGILSPVFSPDIHEYSFSVHCWTTSIVLHSEANLEGGSILIDGQSSTHPISLANGANEITLTIDRGGSHTEYRIIVNRAAADHCGSESQFAMVGEPRETMMWVVIGASGCLFLSFCTCLGWKRRKASQSDKDKLLGTLANSEQNRPLRGQNVIVEKRLKGVPANKIEDGLQPAPASIANEILLDVEEGDHASELGSVAEKLVRSTADETPRSETSRSVELIPTTKVTLKEELPHHSQSSLIRSATNSPYRSFTASPGSSSNLGVEMIDESGRKLNSRGQVDKKAMKESEKQRKEVEKRRREARLAAESERKSNMAARKVFSPKAAARPSRSDGKQYSSFWNRSGANKASLERVEKAQRVSDVRDKIATGKDGFDKNATAIEAKGLLATEANMFQSIDRKRQFRARGLTIAAAEAMRDAGLNPVGPSLYSNFGSTPAGQQNSPLTMGGAPQVLKIEPVRTKREPSQTSSTGLGAYLTGESAPEPEVPHGNMFVLPQYSNPSGNL